MPPRISAAWASGCKKLSVIANNATARTVARQPVSERLRIMAYSRRGSRGDALLKRRMRISYSLPCGGRCPKGGGGLGVHHSCALRVGRPSPPPALSLRRAQARGPPPPAGRAIAYEFFELLPHHMGEVPGGRRGTLLKRFVLSPSGPVGPPPPYDGGGIMSGEPICNSPPVAGDKRGAWSIGAKR